MVLYRNWKFHAEENRHRIVYEPMAKPIYYIGMHFQCLLSLSNRIILRRLLYERFSTILINFLLMLSIHIFDFINTLTSKKFIIINEFIFRATKAGELKVVHELLACGYQSRDAKNHYGQTAVHLASIAGNDDILSEFISREMSVHCRDTAGFTPLHVSDLMFVCSIFFVHYFYFFS